MRTHLEEDWDEEEDGGDTDNQYPALALGSKEGEPGEEEDEDWEEDETRVYSAKKDNDEEEDWDEDDEPS